MRVSVEKFDALLRLVKVIYLKQIMKTAIPARLRLEVTLRFLANGGSFSSLALLFKIQQRHHFKIFTRNTAINYTGQQIFGDQLLLR
jgi:phosphatidylserine/phosphatidylglycerophosphate/cardiolipin synthase-like enzyme